MLIIKTLKLRKWLLELLVEEHITRGEMKQKQYEEKEIGYITNLGLDITSSDLIREILGAFLVHDTINRFIFFRDVASMAIIT